MHLQQVPPPLAMLREQRPTQQQPKKTALLLLLFPVNQVQRRKRTLPHQSMSGRQEGSKSPNERLRRSGNVKLRWLNKRRRLEHQQLLDPTTTMLHRVKASRLRLLLQVHRTGQRRAPSAIRRALLTRVNPKTRATSKLASRVSLLIALPTPRCRYRLPRHRQRQRAGQTGRKRLMLLAPLQGMAMQRQRRPRALKPTLAHLNKFVLQTKQLSNRLQSRPQHSHQY